MHITKFNTYSLLFAQIAFLCFKCSLVSSIETVVFFIIIIFIFFILMPFQTYIFFFFFWCLWFWHLRRWREREEILKQIVFWCQTMHHVNPLWMYLTSLTIITLPMQPICELTSKYKYKYNFLPPNSAKQGSRVFPTENKIKQNKKNKNKTKTKTKTKTKKTKQNKKHSLTYWYIKENRNHGTETANVVWDGNFDKLLNKGSYLEVGLLPATGRILQKVVPPARDRDEIVYNELFFSLNSTCFTLT